MLPEESRMKATSTGELHGGGAGEKETQVSHGQVKCLGTLQKLIIDPGPA